MPYKIRKVRKNNCFSVKNLNKKKTFSKCTTKKNAQKQIRLLRALQYNKKFKPNDRRKTSKGGVYNPFTGEDYNIRKKVFKTVRRATGHKTKPFEFENTPYEYQQESQNTPTENMENQQKGGTKETKPKNKTIKIKMNKKAIAEKEKKEIEKTRPLHFSEYEEWYETVAEEEMNSQLPYMRYLDDYNE